MTDPILERVGDDVWRHQVERSPHLRLRHGMPVEHFPTGGLDEAEADARFATTQLDALDHVDEERLSVDDRLTLRFLRASLDAATRAPERWWWHFPCAPYQLYQLSVVAPQVLAAAADDRARRRALTADYATAVRTITTKLTAQADVGWRLPRPALGGAVATIGALRAGAPSLFGDDADDVTAAFDELLTLLTGDYEKAAPDTVGLSQYPGGADAYAALVRHHATFAITPDEVHRLGLDEVAALTDRMAEVRSRIGYRDNEGEFHARLAAEGRLYAESPDAVEALYRRAIARIEPALGDAFAVLPDTPYDIARVDPALEAGMTYGYYEFPTDASPVGRYRYNGSGLETRSQVNAAALIYHELVPGHHFHVARQQENKALPAVRRDSIIGIDGLTAYAEGWAEYAAHVAGELGMYEDPYDEYGRLVHERFIAQRLVVDSGMNGLGWSLEKARAYMRDTTLESETQVATETLRYATDLPGQALAYRLGDLKLRELRQVMRSGRGSRYDVRDFHEAVLGPGALPMSVLEEHIREVSST